MFDLMDSRRNTQRVGRSPWIELVIALVVSTTLSISIYKFMVAQVQSAIHFSHNEIDARLRSFADSGFLELERKNSLNNLITNTMNDKFTLYPSAMDISTMIGPIDWEQTSKALSALRTSGVKIKSISYGPHFLLQTGPYPWGRLNNTFKNLPEIFLPAVADKSIVLLIGTLHLRYCDIGEYKVWGLSLSAGSGSSTPTKFARAQQYSFTDRRLSTPFGVWLGPESDELPFVLNGVIVELTGVAGQNLVVDEVPGNLFTTLVFSAKKDMCTFQQSSVAGDEVFAAYVSLLASIPGVKIISAIPSKSVEYINNIDFAGAHTRQGLPTQIAELFSEFLVYLSPESLDSGDEGTDYYISVSNVRIAAPAAIGIEWGRLEVIRDVSSLASKLILVNSYEYVGELQVNDIQGETGYSLITHLVAADESGNSNIGCSVHDLGRIHIRTKADIPVYFNGDLVTP